MNHIEIYEKLLKDYEYDIEMKSLIRQLYAMPIEKASHAIVVIGKMINAKVNEYMTVDGKKE